MGNQWKCPNCEALNTDNFCEVCGNPRPVSGLQGGGYGGNGGNGGRGSNKGLLIALVSIVAVLLIVVVGFVAYSVLNEPDPAPTPAPDPAPASAPVYYVNAFSDSGIFVREGPGKSYDDILYIKEGDVSVKLLYLGEKELGGDNFFWYHVETPSGKVGYVREDVVVIAE